MANARPFFYLFLQADSGACEGYLLKNRAVTLTTRKRLLDGCSVPLPVEPRPRVGLAPRSDIAMARNIERAEARLQLAREARERFVLRLGEGHVVGALELDADGEVVALLAPVPRRDARMPRAHLGRHVLDHGAVAANEVVRRHLHRRNPGEIRMGLRIEAPHEEVVDPRAAVLVRRQRDVVDHDERDLLALGARVAVRRAPSRCQGGGGGGASNGRGARGAWGRRVG